MASKETKHLVIDMKTGFAYGIVLDGDGKCVSAMPFNNDVQKLDGTSVKLFGPLVGVNPASITPANANPLPYGQTTVAVELAQDGSRGKVFTIKWPSKEDAQNGVTPLIAVRQLPADLVQAGFAARPASTTAVAEEQALEDALKNINDMIGLDVAKRDIKQNIAIARFNRLKEEMGLTAKPISRHMVFTGNPGTGKTTFAREVAKIYHALGFIGRPNVTEVTRKDLVGGFIGQTAKATTAKIEEAVGIERDKDGNIVVSDKPKGGILFIDEAYDLARSGDDGKDFGKESINTLVAAMENMREDLVVIVAGYTDPMKNFIDTNPGLKSRFMTYIEFSDYNLQQLGEIMDFMVKDRGYTLAPDAREHAMALLEKERSRSGKDFGNGRTVRNLVEMAEKELAMRLDSEDIFTRKDELTTENMTTALTTITLEDVKRVNLRGISDTSIGISFGEVTRPPVRANDDSRIKPTPHAPNLFPAAEVAVGAKTPRRRAPKV